MEQYPEIGIFVNANREDGTPHRTRRTEAPAAPKSPKHMTRSAATRNRETDRSLLLTMDLIIATSYPALRGACTRSMHLNWGAHGARRRVAPFALTRTTDSAVAEQSVDADTKGHARGPPRRRGRASPVAAAL